METNNKLREALEKMSNLFEKGVICTHYANTAEEMEQIEELYQMAKAILAEPVKNCEVGTAEEQRARFIAFCKGQRIHSFGHADTCNPKCPCRDGGDLNLCALTWAQMPYEEGGNDER